MRCKSGGGSRSITAHTPTPTTTVTQTQTATLTGAWYGAAHYLSCWPSRNMVVKIVPFEGGHFFIANYPPSSLTVKTVVHGTGIKVGDTFHSKPVDKSSYNWGLCTWVEPVWVISNMFAGSSKVDQFQITS